MSEVLVTPGHTLEAHCAAVALTQAGMRASLVPAADVTAVVVFAAPEELAGLGPASVPASPRVPVLLVCPVVDDAALRAADRLGATDVIAWDGSTDELLDAVAGAVRGESSLFPRPEADRDPLVDLTHRELQIARLIGSGASNVGIADSLGISYHTVRTHVGHLLAKLGITHRYAVVPLVQRSERARRLYDDYAGAAAR